MNENDEQINELFSENKEMIIFTIAKQFKQPTLACKNKKNYNFILSLHV